MPPLQSINSNHNRPDNYNPQSPLHTEFDLPAELSLSFRSFKSILSTAPNNLGIFSTRPQEIFQLGVSIIQPNYSY